MPSQVTEVSMVDGAPFVPATTTQTVQPDIMATGIQATEVPIVDEADEIPVVPATTLQAVQPDIMATGIQATKVPIVNEADESESLLVQPDVATPVKLSGAPVVTPEMIRPLPQANRRPGKGRAQKASEITGSPFKQQVMEKEQARNKKQLPVARKKGKPVQPKPKTCKGKALAKSSIPPKRSLKFSTVSAATKACASHEPYTSTGSSTANKIASTSYMCPSCDEVFVDPPSEAWIQCCFCERWWHEACTSYEGGPFVCELC
jgi:hypothetical protein